MKKILAIGAALLVSVLFTFQPATADSVLVPVAVVEEAITAQVVEIPQPEPVVETTPASTRDHYDELKNPLQTDPADLLPVPAPTGLPTAPVWTPPAATVPTTELPAAPLEAPVTAPDVIMEDDPRFDCNTMGNLLCGSAQYAVPVNVEEVLNPQCVDPATVDPAVIRWCAWKAAQ